MNGEPMHDAELLDFLLGELPPERAEDVEARIAADPALARELERYQQALSLLRAAAREESWAPPRRRRGAVRVAIAVAAVLLVALGLFWMERGGPAPARVFEPDRAFGALFPEELGPDGGFIPRVEQNGTRLVRGAVSSGAIGARARFPLAPGDSIPDSAELVCGVEQGALIALPHGGLLFLGPLARVQLRPRADGRVALRLEAGAAATVVGSEPIHAALDGTDLLLTQHDGAALYRHPESDALCLRGRIELHLESGERWKIPPGHLLPAACAHQPESTPFRVERLELDWYEQLYDCRMERATVKLDAEGRSAPLAAAPNTMIYLALSSRAAGDVRVRFGDGEGRVFHPAPGTTLEVRVPLSSLGEGPVLSVTPPESVKVVRLLDVH